MALDPIWMLFQDVLTHAILAGLVADPELLISQTWVSVLTQSADMCSLTVLTDHATTLHQMPWLIFLESLGWCCRSKLFGRREHSRWSSLWCTKDVGSIARCPVSSLAQSSCFIGVVNQLLANLQKKSFAVEYMLG
jgi:hypothetical protein